MSNHNSAISLLAALKEIGCRVWVKDGKLKIRAPKAGITEELKEQLKVNREKILEHLDSLQAQDTRLAGDIPVLPPGSPPVMSHAQQRLWFLVQLEGSSATYNMPAVLRLEGPLDINALQSSLHWMVERHESLRMAFPERDGEAGVVALSAADFEFPVRDVRHWLSDEKQLRRHIDAHALAPFDLARGPLFRAEILQLAKEDGQAEGGQAKDKQATHVLLINMHHIISDGWSREIFVREWREAYAAFAKGESPGLAPLPIQYTDYAVWQRQWLQGQVLERQSDYWREAIEGIPALLALPTDYPRPARQDYRGNHYSQILSADVTAALNTLSREQGATLFMTLLAAFDVLLARYSGQDDICVGSPIANRIHVQTENLIGFFLNTIVLRIRLNPDQGFRALLQQVRQTCLGAYAHQDIPFETLVEQLNPARSLSHSPLFQVMLVLQNNATAEMELPGLTITPLAQDYPIAKFDLTLNIVEQDGQLYCTWEYATSLFTIDTIRRMGEHFEVLLRGIVEDPERPVFQLPLLTEAERRRILVKWNDTKVPYPQDECIHELFEAQVTQTPDAVAILFEDEEISYFDLNARANRLAHRLRKLGVGPEVLVGLFVERSVEMVVGILAILKAGGAYVPLDPDYPVERLAFMAEDADLKVLLCHGATRERVPECAAAILNMDEDAEGIAGENSENPERFAGPNNLAYVIYTSGSTGKPKGVAIEHRNTMALLHWGRVRYSHEELSGVLAATSVCFDLSVYEIFLPLAVGGTIVLVEDALALAITGNSGRVSLVNTVPSAIKGLLDSGGIPDCVRTINLAGEPLSQDIVNKLYELAGVQKVYDLYGPSEDTTYSTCALRQQGGSPTIGRPISNTQAYILDSQRKPVPIGVPGELYMGGAGVARGYLNHPDLTAERFIPDLFSIDTIGDDIGVHLYRTGDSCRWLPDGNIEFLGRIDTQVKIRGFRIECGEVENALLSHSDVREVVVDAHGEKVEKKLVAWLVGTDVGAIHESPLRDELRTHLRASLPDWMVPTRFVFLDALPLTPSGKIDRRALPAPEASDLPGAEYIEPISPTEELLAGLWAVLLERETVGSFDNFFDLGGHSLLAMQLISRIRDSFDVELPVRVVFEHPELSAMAKAIESSSGLSHQLPPIEPQPAHTPRLPSFAQQRLWFLERFGTGRAAAYSYSGVVRIDGALDMDAVQSAIYWVLERHEDLRMAFPEQDGQIGVVVLPTADFEVSVRDLRHLPFDERQLYQYLNARAVTPFDLERGPLFRVEFLQFKGEDGQTFYVERTDIHQILTDDRGIDAYAEELIDAYFAFVEGKSPEPAPLPILYSDYTAWQRQWLQGEILEEQQAWWKDNLAGIPELLELPTDYPRPAQRDYRGNYYHQALSAEVTAALETLSREQGVTRFMTLLAAFDVLLARYSGQDDICVGTISRNRAYTHTENIIGPLANTLVLRTRLNPEQGFRDLLQQVRQTCLGAYAHQDLPFKTLVEQINPARALSHSPLFQVMLVARNFSGAKIELPGLTIANPEEDELSPAKYDLTVNFWGQEDGRLYYRWEYATSLFTMDTIRRMGEHFEVLLQSVVEDPERPVSRLPLLTEAERERILLEWNDTVAPYPKDKCVHGLFEEQAARTPNAVAILFEDEEIGYGELNARANRLAHRLRALGVGPEVLVGLFMERSVEMVVGTLAILKAGGAYVPLDPEYPQEHLAFMAEDAGLAVLLCHGATRERVPECAAAILDMDGEAEAIAEERSDNPAPLTRPENLAYVIYTSESTGKPKGVMVEHGMIASHVLDTVSVYGLESRDRVLQFASIGFDSSVEQIFGPLMVGAALVLRGKKIWTPQDCLDNFVRYRVSVAHMTPVYVRRFLGAAIGHWEELGACGFRLLNSSGEVLPSATIEFWRETASGVGRFLNTYGPTEATVAATAFEVSADWSGDAATAPIGKPLSGRAAYILDSHGRPVPVGIPGELYIGGTGVARGYLNRPELTAERFIPDPFSDDPQARLYRTGDLCRWLPDGTIAKGDIEYLGRIDTQVKIRGFRIKCGEVGNALLSHPDVREAVVDARGEGEEKQLVAWVVATDVGAIHESPLRDELRTHLRISLPDWMAPARFVFVKALPLTPDGKIDRRALPEPDGDGSSPENEYTAPRNPTEEILCRIFADVLEVPRIGIHDDFFDLGGDSLLAIKIISSIRKDLRMEIPLRALFQHPTPKELAVAIRARKQWKPDILLPLKSGSSGASAPLFCIHPMSGGAFCYRELADCLDSDRPVYGIQAPGFDRPVHGIQALGFEGETEPLTDVEAMAARYVAEITARWPEGPYHLYGWSLGGVVAFEMARQLRSMDREVGLLVLADTVCPHPSEKWDEPGDEEVLLHLLAEAGELEPEFFHGIENATLAERRALLRQRPASGSKLAGFGDIEHFVRVYRANLQAILAYRPSPWEGEIVFLSARERIGEEGEPLESGWREFAREIARHTVPGNHFTMHRQPNVQEIAKILELL